MRLYLTLPELEAGASIQSGPSERIIDLEMLAHNRQPVAINPIQDHDHKMISAVLLTDVEHYGRANTLRLRFTPFWCKTFTLCSAKKDSILSLVMQFEDGQYWIYKGGWRESHLTLDGPGTDPKIVYNSQFVLGDLLVNYPRPDLIGYAIQLIKEKFLPSPSPVAA